MAIRLLNWLKPFFFEEQTSLHNRAEWLPALDGQKSGPWSVIVRDSALLFPWRYSTHFLQGKRWIEHDERVRGDLVHFLKRLASLLPDHLWPDKHPERRPEHVLGRCFDVRLLDFSLERFDRPDVIEAIAKLASEFRDELPGLPEEIEGRAPQPVKHYKFKYSYYGEAVFAVCWYVVPGSLAWPHDDILRVVPDAEELKVAINSFQDVADQLVPPAPLLELADLPPVPAEEKRRPTFLRRLDGGKALDEAYDALDAVLNPVHDFMLSTFQRWLDNLAGQACPLHDDNKRLVAMTMERVDRWGIGLFLERKEGLVQVRVDARPARGSLQSNPEGRTASAGLFAVRTYDQASGKSNRFSELATFPQLIAARDMEQANRIWEARKRASG